MRNGYFLVFLEEFPAFALIVPALTLLRLLVVLMMIQITGIIVRKMVLLLNYRARGACIAGPDRPPLAWSPPTYGTVL